jgi:4-amino-4-deoxy-L-arabinose transferase-like glycosyltransferase
MAVLLTAIYLAGVASVPFHPDETSWLFQSRDLEALASHPSDLAWRAGAPSTPETTYRALNAPLAKYVLGIGRRLAGFDASSVAVDWDWMATWQANVERGALPPRGLLLAARLASAALYPASLGLMYLAGRRAHNMWTGLAAMLFFGLHALVLLHTRRAMAEGALTFGVSLAIFGMLQGDRRPWLAGLGFALAMWSKQSTAVLLPASLLAVVWSGEGFLPWRHAIRNLALALGVIAAVTLALNPFLWHRPAEAARQMLEARREFVRRQTSTLEAMQPGVVLNDPGLRLAVMVDQLYLAAPQCAESGNYVAETQAATDAYLENPLHRLGRSLPAGGILLALTITGMGLAMVRAFGPSPHRRGLVLLLLATLLQAIGLWAAVPLPYQRYVIPLVPFACVWAAYGATAFAPRRQTA